MVSTPLARVAPAGSPEPSVPRYHSIREIDFRNFTYEWFPDWCDTSATAKRITLRRGLMNIRCGKDQDPAELSLTDMQYGELTADGSEEAVITLRIIMAGTARPHLILVYTLSDGQPKRLWIYETGDRAREGLHTVSVESGQLVIELYKPVAVPDDSRQMVELASSDRYTRNYYAWNGREFFKTKTEERPTDLSDTNPWVVRKQTAP